MFSYITLLYFVLWQFAIDLVGIILQIFICWYLEQCPALIEVWSTNYLWNLNFADGRESRIWPAVRVHRGLLDGRIYTNINCYEPFMMILI